MSSSPIYLHPADVQGLSRLAIDGVIGTAGLVEQLHYAIARVSGPTLPARNGKMRGISGLVYRSIHGITGLVGSTTDRVFGQIVSRLAAPQSTPQRDRFLALLNGVLGDQLEATGNPLTLAMELRDAGTALVNDPSHLAARFPAARPRIAIFIHGLCMSDHHWTPTADGHERTDLPRLVHDAAGFQSLHVCYNSGRTIASNGLALAEQLEALVRHWPVPVAELALIGHSMGGLVARSALHHAELNGYSWPGQTQRLITLGSPHLGAPLERIGDKVDRALTLTPFSAPFARLGAIRSAGITDLRFGHLTQPGERLLQPRHVRVHAVAATLADDARALKSRTIGDGLVPVGSALGRHRDPEQRLPTHRTAVVPRTGHLELMHHPSVAGHLRNWLTER